MTLHQKHSLRFLLISIATLLYFFANIQRSAVPGAIFDLLQGDFLIDASKITLLGAIFCYVYAFVQLIVGLMVDKIGGFRVVALGGVVFSIGALLFPLADNLALLYLSRALVGFGGATFYLSTIREVKKFAKDKNFSLAVSYILFVGYFGGVVANAPLVLGANNFGWRAIFCLIAFITIFLSIIYLIALFVFKPIHIEKETKWSLAPFREVLLNKDNIHLYIFGATNYGLYYVLQSVIGKKFLEDFSGFEVSTSALILSIMAIISALAGTISAFISKKLDNKRAIIFKTYAILSIFSVTSVFLCLFFNFHTKLIALIFCIPSFIGSISPLLIANLHLINKYEITATAVAIQNFSFFMMVGILGMVSGMLMNVFKPIEIEGALIYPNQSYLLVFGLFFIISAIELIYAFKLKDEY